MRQFCYAPEILSPALLINPSLNAAPDGRAEGQDAVVVLERLRRSSKVLPSMALSFKRTTTSEQIGKWDEAAKSRFGRHLSPEEKEWVKTVLEHILTA